MMRPAQRSGVAAIAPKLMRLPGEFARIASSWPLPWGRLHRSDASSRTEPSVIYREMPAIWDPDFRRSFYQRWGRESAVISARCRRAEYPDYTQLLSIKMLRGGSEDYFIDGRRLAVDDDTYLIVNGGRRYGSCIASLATVHSFSVFFEPGLAAEVHDGLTRSLERQLECPVSEASPELSFDEHLREHDALVTPVLRHIAQVVDSGTATETGLDEQLRILLARMLRAERRVRRRTELICARPALRIELQRRLDRARSFMHTHYNEPIRLREIALAAHLSPFHLLRSFKAAYGSTPAAFLSRKRIGAAVRLIESTDWPLSQIAEHVGFGCRSTLFRQLRAAGIQVGARRARVAQP